MDGGQVFDADLMAKNSLGEPWGSLCVVRGSPHPPSAFTLTIGWIDNFPPPLPGRDRSGLATGGGFRAAGLPPAYSYPRVIHRSEESPEGLLPAASVNNSAAQKYLVMKAQKISPCGENTHRLATNSPARHSTPKISPSRQAMRRSLTNPQQQTAHRSHYKPFAGIGQRVFLCP